ncbi:MAG: chemotaxis protein CheW [Bacteroidota bacterium]
MEQKSKEKEAKSYLTFKLGEEQFGVHVSQVLNILEMTSITRVPKSPDYMKGVINLRGKVLPVIDARLKFGMEETEYTNNTCIIVMDLEMDGKLINIGTIVDGVLSVVEIDENEVEPPPSIGSKFKSEFIYGMAKVEEEFVMLVDMQKVISADEMTEISNKSKTETEKAKAAEDNG